MGQWCGWGDFPKMSHVMTTSRKIGLGCINRDASGTEYSESTPAAETAEESRRRKRKQKTSGASSTHNGEFRRCMSSVMSFISNSLNVCLILFCVFTEFLLWI